MLRPGADRLVQAVAWLVAVGIAAVPVAIAAASPLQSGRDAFWIVGGMAGIVSLGLLLFQPLLIGGVLQGLRRSTLRRWHRWIGGAVVAAIVLHVGGLYLASPEDVTDALLLVSPTPFSLYGLIGLWSLLLTALLACVRSRATPTFWRIVHSALAVIVVSSAVVHTLLIDGAMGEVSKLLLCLCVLAATTAVTLQLNIVRLFYARRRALAPTLGRKPR